jgi:cytochrome c oxidase subunit 2
MKLTSRITAAFGALLALPAWAEEAYIGMAVPKQLSFQPAASPVMERLVSLHDFLLIIITVITVFVTLLIAYVCIRFRKSANPVASKNSHNTTIEVIWTVAPILILAVIFIPSYRLHYECVHSIGCNEDGMPSEPDLTLKIVGYQWYWNYEYPGADVQFDSYMKQEKDLLPGEPRLLAVDNPVVVPVGANVRLHVTGGDVIHNWAMPAFGVKQDTIPGRLNETWFRAEREGTFYGQCSELCGQLHGFMPIQVEVVSQEFYDKWLGLAAEDMDAASQMVAAHRGRIDENNFAQLEEQ